MINVSSSYDVKWRIKFSHNYQFTDNGICINTHRNKIVRRVLKSSCIGYNINGKFYSLTKLRTQLERIPKEECPF
jgi:hypothetical protein